MNYKRRLVILSIIFLATGVVAFFSLKRGEVLNSSSEAYAKINLTDTSAIEKIELVTPESRLTLQRRNGITWMVTDKLEARKQLISLLFFGLSKMEVKRPVAEQDVQLLARKIKEGGARVNIQMGSSTRSFYILSNPSDPNSSLYMENNNSKLYIVYVPGVKGDLASLLKLGVNDWRTKEIFDNRISSIQSLKLEYPGKEKDNFEIVFDKAQFIVTVFPEADSVKIKKYISLIPYLAVDRYLTADKDAVQSAIKGAERFGIFSLFDEDPRKSTVLRIYFAKEKKMMMALNERTGELVTLNPQLWRYALVPRKFFERKRVE